MDLLDTQVANVASHAGWAVPGRDEDGSYSFRLENSLDFSIFSPDGRIAVLRAELSPLPASGPEREEALLAAARRQAGVCRLRASVAALEKPGQSLLRRVSGSADMLILYRVAELAAAKETFADIVRDFLNDLAWWKAATADNRAGRSMGRPFFGGLGMPGDAY